MYRFRLFIFLSFFSLFHCHFAYSNNDDCLIVEIEAKVKTANDDAEERPDGSMYMNSSDLELVFDPDAGDQLVGIRFDDLAIPQGAEILSAHIQFTTDEVSTGTTEVFFHAEAIDDAPPFISNNNNLSNRTNTNNQINWVPGSWSTVGSRGAWQQTPDLAPIVQEIIDRDGWSSGNAMAFLVSGSGRRTAMSYELDPQNAASLIIEVAIPTPQIVLQNIFINELMPANGIVQDQYGEADDWIEIYNGGPEIAVIGGLYLTDDLDDLKKWRLNAPLTIAPGGFQLLWADEQEEQGGDHLGFKLSKSGEFLALVQELNDELFVLDAVEFPETPLNVSYGRQEDGISDWVFFSEISPDFSNNGNDLYLDETVKFSISGGIYSNALSLEMSIEDPQASIYYTLSGNEPTDNEILYTGPINISTTQIVKAKAFKEGYSGAQTTSETYIINEFHDLPILTVSTDPANLWDNNEGIYVSGTNGIPGYCSEEPRNWNQDWERPCRLAFYETNGDKAFQVNGGFKIGGGCSRGMKMKSFNFFMRNSKYGDELIDYQIFPNIDIQEFRRFKVRNSGNDFEQMLFRDGVNQSLLFNTVDIDLMAYRPVVVYLNGTYWGVYGLREFFNEDYVASHHGVDPENVDIITNPLVPWYEVKDGDAQDMNTLKSFFNTSNLSNPINYEHAQSKIDINEYINYHIAQIYLGNFDWPANNVRAWRDKDNGKWRWMLFDTDATTNYGWWSESNANDNTLIHALNSTGNAWPNGPESTLFLRKLMENSEFLSEFVQRTCTFRELIFDPVRVNPIVDSIQLMIQPEMNRHLNRWNQNLNGWGWGTPSGGSLQSWFGFIDTYKDFFPARQSSILNHYRIALGLEGTYHLTFNYDATTPGTITIHENEMAIPFDYHADYFKNLPLKVRVVPQSGYQFSHWKETGETSPEIEFIGNENTSLTPIFVPLVPILTEIHYHPKEGIEFEFLEFYNASNLNLDISNFRISQGVEFEFPNGTTLAPQENILVVKDKNSYPNFGCQVFEWESGELNDAGEPIEVLNENGDRVQYVSYSNQFPWDISAAGEGSSLSLKSPELNNQLSENWEASFVRGGTPCGEQSPVLNNPQEALFSLDIFPNPVRDILILNYMSIDETDIEIEIINSLGQICKTEVLTKSFFPIQKELSVLNWASGVYFIRIKGEREINWRFVKA